MAGAFHRSCRRQMGHHFSFPALQYILAGASSVAQFTRSKTLEIKTVALRFSVVGSRGESNSAPSQLLCGTVLQDCTYSTQSRGDIRLGTPRRPWPIPSIQESPASIWQMTEVRNLVKTTQGTTWAIYQCHFGADSPKPTRFISNRDFQQQFSGFASFNADNTYVGPLPQQCGHRFHVKKLIGKHEGQWRTSPSAAYPSGVCKYLAKLLLSRLEGESGHLDINTEKPLQQPQPGVQQKQADTTGDSPPSTSSDTVSEAEDMSIQGEDQQSPTPGHQPTIEHATCAGSPIQCNWDGDYHFLADGFGFCSPNRWHPRDRCCFEQPDSKTFTSKIFSLLDQAVTQHLGDARKAAFELALGRMQGSPFSEETLTGLRRTWASLLPRPETTSTPSEGQPFFLELMSQSLRILGDPDWRILTQDEESFATGVPLGYDQPLPRVPQVFPPKEKHRKLDDSEFSEVAQNYKSADEMAAELEKKFREEEKQGRMFPATMGSLKQDFRVARYWWPLWEQSRSATGMFDRSTMVHTMYR